MRGWGIRLLVALIAVLVFGALLILNPVALVELGFACVTGQCGVPAPWLAAAAAVILAIWIFRRWRSRVAARRVRRKPRRKRATK
jgi:membrane protein implicated in regulation of membrane protease activity